MYTWIIEDKLAQSPLPAVSMLNSIAKVFTGVVVLPTANEVGPIYLDYLKSLGVDLLHIPTHDRFPVDLLDILRASAFIERQLEMGGKVLVHCYGGLGRSGLITASYLVFKGMSVQSALSHVRERIPGSVENKWQVQVLEDYGVFLRAVDRNNLTGFIEAIEDLVELDSCAYRHLSKVIQFTIELHRGFNLKHIDLEKELLISMVHSHKKEISEVLRRKIGFKAGESSGGELSYLAHLLDYREDSRAVVIDIEDIDGGKVKLLCSYPCQDVADKLKRDLAKLIDKISQHKLKLDWDLYLNHV
ncbi:MAG: dual specificity protein phosphatase family protein [Desulfurococcaceae archaeon]